MMGDIKSPLLLWAKGLLFLLVGVFAATILVLQTRSLTVAVLLGVTVWAFCRSYYFAFYVIEHYVDPNYRFAGLISFVRYAMTLRSPSTRADA
jgi:hypothetical protein